MAQHSVKHSITFQAGVYLEKDAIDSKTGALDLRKIYLYVTPSADVREVHVTTTLQVIGIGHFIGVLTAHMGPAKAGQKIVYAGVSCDAAPTNMIAGAGAKLSADVIVIFAAATDKISGAVEPYPTK